MLRFALICTLATLPLAALPQVAAAQQANSHSSGSGGADSSSRPAVPEPAPGFSAGSGLRTIPRDWQASTNATQSAPPKDRCGGERKVGGFCMIN